MGTGTGNVNVENETEAVNNRDITDNNDTTEAMEGVTETIAEVVEATDFTAEANQANQANQANVGFNEDDDLGITEETAAAIDSIVSSIDVVEELQDDVDLGLDVIPDDPGDVSDHDRDHNLDHGDHNLDLQENMIQDHEIANHEDHHQSELASRDHLIPSPHDIEISHEESTSASSPLDTLSQNFYQSQPRTPVLCLERLRIGSDCISNSKNGRVDLKKLQKASPGLFPTVIKLLGTKKDVVGKGGDTAKGKGSHLDYKKKEKKTMKKEDVKKKEIKVNINSDGSSSDDSDSDLEELRKKIMKPSLFKDTKPSTSNQSSASDKPKQTTKVKDTPKKKEPIKQQPVISKPVQGNNKPVQGMLGLNKFDLKLHRLSETEISKWTTKSDFKKRTVSVNSRESSKSSKEIKGTKSKALIDDSSSSDSDDASKSAPVKKAKEKTPVKKISRSNSSSRSRSSSRSPVRLISRSNSSSSSSDNEKESASTENDKKTAPQSGFKNPLFMLNQKNKEGKSDEDVKQVLVEKLFSLLSNEENNKEKQENVETAAAEPMDVDNVEKVEH